MKRNKQKKASSFDQTQIIYLLAGVVLLVAIILGIWFVYGYFVRNKIEMSSVKPKNEEEQVAVCDYQRILDGVCVETANEVNPKLVGIMVENHSEARPQSGLSKASIVYEAPVEANYTRFLLIYPADANVDEVGPVRSARPYYLDWLSEYGDALYMHVGGSQAALDKITQLGLNDLNEFYRGWYYWRSERRSAPHNVYTSSELWNKALETYKDNYKNQEYGGWKFNTSTVANVETVKDIVVSFLPPIYEATWKYNTSTNKYERYQMGESHVDFDGTPIVADTVIVQSVTSQVLDSVGRLKIDTIGEGEVLIFENGQVIKGTWKKIDRTSRTRFYDSSGEEIKLNPGKIWIEVANERTEVSY